MRKGWEYKKLGEVGQIVTGFTPSTKDESNYSPKEYCFVKPSDLPSQGIADIEETEYFVSQVGLSKSRVLPTGSVLVSCIGSIGKIGILTKEACSNQQINAIIPQDETDSRFIAYSLYAQRFVLESIANAPVVPIINKTDFSKIRIGIPPKSTQLAIVSELDKINELIRLKKEQLKDFDNLAQSLFYEMFGDPVENEKGWEAKKLGEIGEFKNGLNFSKDENGHSIKFLGVSDFQNKKSIASDQLDCISLSECVQEDYLLKTGDIVFVRSNGKKELIGRSVKMYITEPTTYSGFCIRCRITDEKVDKDYIAILLKTPIIRQFMTNSGRGCNISNLNQKVLNSIPTILPPLPLQRLFAQRIEQIEREKSEVQKSIQNLETLLASRMQYWFE